ncbi:hypothetical protein IAS59_006078 [Cryptococcus gattii]
MHQGKSLSDMRLDAPDCRLLLLHPNKHATTNAESVQYELWYHVPFAPHVSPKLGLYSSSGTFYKAGSFEATKSPTAHHNRSPGFPSEISYSQQ